MTRKLLVRVGCSICRGKKALSCIYCDLDGNTVIEASINTIVDRIMEKYTEKERRKIALMLLGKDEEEKE